MNWGLPADRSTVFGSVASNFALTHAGGGNAVRVGVGVSVCVGVGVRKGVRVGVKEGAEIAFVGADGACVS